MEKNVEKKHNAVVTESNKKFKKEEKSIICPHCSAIVTLECKPSQRIAINCPICDNEGMVSFKSEERKFEKLETEKTNIQKGKEKKHADKIGTRPPKIQSFVRSIITGLTLITIGVIFLSNPTIPNIKISFTLILIGFILIFILPEKSSFKKIRLSMSDTITLTLVIWIIFLFFITGDTDLEVFFVLIFIGMLVVKELTDELITIRLKHRMDGFIYVFLITFIWIIGEKIINILNM